ncbi:hypothetical protein BDQ17DRAFT_1315431 [Cyathus striatus]|nr:hypothetical protein BDQ17DRAFT_1315431 [Cyathus striatus]
MGNESPSVKLAEVPFNDEKADLILRSSDGVDFYVYKVILSLASNFFQDMFSLPQPENDGRQSVDMPEHSITLDAILRLCYPVKDPIIQEWSPAVKILQAATKYQMNEATELMFDVFKRFIPSCPLAVYGVACDPSISSEMLARLAAQEWMKKKSVWACLYEMRSFPSYRVDNISFHCTVQWKDTSIGQTYDAKYMDTTTAGQLYRLLRCVRSKQLPPKLLVNEDPVGETTTKWNSVRKLPAADDTRLLHGDTTIRSSDGCDFRAHKLVIQLASQKLLTSMENSSQSQSKESVISAIPVYCLPEHSNTIYKVLEICDPSASAAAVEAGDADIMHNVLHMAIKYDIPKAMSIGKLWCTNLVKENPLRSYFTAICYGWEELARQSARATLFSSIENAYTPEMEHVSAQSYYNLMKYHHDFQRELSTILKTRSPKDTSSLYDILFSIWKVKDEEEHSFNTQWNDELTNVLSYVTRISLLRENFCESKFKTEFDSFNVELITN